MDTSSHQSPVDPGELARLVLKLRDLCADIEKSKPGLPSPEETPFLHRQLTEQIEAIHGCLADFAPKQSKKKKGLFGKVFGRETDKRQRFPDLEGNSWTIPVSELIGFLSTARKTGVLSVEAEDERFVIEIQNGNLIRAVSNRTPEGLRLGELLVKQGSLKANEVSEVVNQAKKHNLSLGGYLIQSGRADEADLKQALSTQVQGLFDRLMCLGNALYRFQEGVDLEDAKELDLNVTQLLLESARQMDEAEYSDSLPSIIGVEPDLEQINNDLAEVFSMTNDSELELDELEPLEPEEAEAALQSKTDDSRPDSEEEAKTETSSSSEGDEETQDSSEEERAKQGEAA